MDLEKLIARCRAGDELAWEMLVRRFQNRVFGLAVHYLGNREDARDLAQEVFLRIYNRLESCTGADLFIPWMIRITRNACIDRIRRAQARPVAAPLPLEDYALPSGDPGPEELRRASSRNELLHSALGRLGPANREMILLKEIEGLTFEEIASLLEIPVGTVKSRSSRARVELARVLTGRRPAAVSAEGAGGAP